MTRLVDESNQNAEGGVPPADNWTVHWAGSGTGWGPQFVFHIETARVSQARFRLSMGEDGMETIRKFVLSLERMLETNTHQRTAVEREQMEWGRDHGRWVIEEFEGEVPEAPAPPASLRGWSGALDWIERVRRWIEEETQLVTDAVAVSYTHLTLPTTVATIGYDIGGAVGEVCPNCGSELEEVVIS